VLHCGPKSLYSQGNRIDNIVLATMWEPQKLRKQNSLKLPTIRITADGEFCDRSRAHARETDSFAN